MDADLKQQLDVLSRQLGEKLDRQLAGFKARGINISRVLIEPITQEEADRLMADQDLKAEGQRMNVDIGSMVALMKMDVAGRWATAGLNLTDRQLDSGYFQKLSANLSSQTPEMSPSQLDPS